MKNKKREVRKEKYIKVKPYTGKDGKKYYYLTVQFEYIAQDGQKRSYLKTFNSIEYLSVSEAMNAACDHRDIKRGELLTGNMISKTDVTVGDLFGYFRQHFSVEYGTYLVYKYIYQNYIEEKFGNKKITDITVFDIQETINAAVEVRNKAGMAKIRTFWKYMFKIARAKNLINYDLSADVSIPKSKKIPKEHACTVSDENLNLVINYLRTSQARTESKRFNYEMVSYALMTIHYLGLRPAEVYALKRSQIHNDGLHIGPRVSIDENRHTKINPSKTPESNRILPISDPCKAELNAAMAMSESEFIFPNHKGQLFNPSKVSEWISKISKTLGVDFRMYDLRHEFATSLLNGSYGEMVDLNTVQSLMGHADPSMTLRYARKKDENIVHALSLISSPESSTIYPLYEFALLRTYGGFFMNRFVQRKLNCGYV